MQDTQNAMIIQELVRRSNEDTRRLRSVEQRLDAIEGRLSAMEQTELDRSKKSNSKFAEHDVFMKSMDDEIQKLRNAMDKINRQILDFARKRDIKEIEKMFELISPIREEFVTKDELEDELRYGRGNNV